MAENNTPNNFPFPPFGPPPHGGCPGGPPPPFWDFINSMADGGRNGAAGAGVDHNPDHGFEFGPDGFNAWSGPHGFGGAWGRRGRGGWGFGMGPRGGCRGHGRHGHGFHHHTQSPFDSGNDEDLNDVTVAAAVAEAEMEAARDNEKDGSPATMRDAGDEHPDPPEVPPAGQSGDEGRRFRGCRGGCRGFGRGRGRGRGRGPAFGGPPFGGPPFGGHHAGGPPFGPPPFGGPPPFDFDAMMENFSQHPYAQRIREYYQRIRDLAQQGDNGEGERGDDNSFTPPVDIFDTTNNWTIHIAVPGAKKEDVGVNWDAGKSTLTVSGVVHRPGNEEFLSSMISGERRVGLFERKIKLPPVQEGREDSKDEVDGDHITAKMEDGILVVIVPKVEKEWTEIKKVDIL
ncbi:hypothetical protein OQA88_10340 [Cercophora sp. LCS_1]